MVDKAAAAKSVQDLANKIKQIMGNPDLIASLAEQDSLDGSVSEALDELEAKVSELEKLYSTDE